MHVAGLLVLLLMQPAALRDSYAAIRFFVISIAACSASLGGSILSGSFAVSLGSVHVATSETCCLHPKKGKPGVNIKRAGEPPHSCCRHSCCHALFTYRKTRPRLPGKWLEF